MKKIIYLIVFVCIASQFSCDECEEIMAVPCGGSSTSPMVDLVVLIDASGSMGTAASAVNSSADTAIEQAKLSCGTDLRVVFLALEGTFPSTLFSESSRNYLQGLHGLGIVLAADRDPLGFGPEQGANGIEDISKYFDWRESACRAIFYISDEELDGCCEGFSGGSTFSRYDGTNEMELDEEINETDLAIVAAQLSNVAVFSHLLDTPEMPLHPEIKNLYEKLSSETGGIHTVSPNASSELYLSILPEAICNSCNACKLNDFIN